MQELKFTDDFKAQIFKAKSILAVRFIENQPTEYISSDLRWNDLSQRVVLREDILRDWTPNTNK
jgi:hypothetical protein